ncbi:MAG TPA: succinate dehydrogenase, hydrophobic membrane anchor protein [Coxiellaceae bacterium]|nr:succinate dehydrogenase, hydrophobic membrane anchor protein [Coxiellaceae bacterium]
MVMRASRRGLAEWLFQRISAVLLLGYSAFIVGFMLTHPHINFYDWELLFSCLFVQITTYVVIIALVGHIWIGIWTVLTDYMKCAWGRLILEILLALLLLGYLIWGAKIVWA